MAKRTLSILQQRIAMIAFGIVAIASSFSLGVHTSADIQTVAPSEASMPYVGGDMNADGIVDLRDVIIILEIAQGYTDPTTEQLRNDPNQDGTLDTDDAIALLSDLSIR